LSPSSAYGSATTVLVQVLSSFFDGSLSASRRFFTAVVHEYQPTGE
jgi:hypothetical protein